MQKRIIVWVIAAFILVAYFAAIEMPKGKSVDESSLIGKTAPDFTLSDYNGNSITLSSLKGKLVMVVFWFPT